MDTNKYRKPYGEETRKYWREWYATMSAEERKEFNRKRYLRAKELKAEKQLREALPDASEDAVKEAIDSIKEDI